MDEEQAPQATSWRFSVHARHALSRRQPAYIRGWRGAQVWWRSWHCV